MDSDEEVGSESGGGAENVKDDQRKLHCIVPDKVGRMSVENCLMQRELYEGMTGLLC